MATHKTPTTQQRSYFLELVVFVSGAVVMILELTGSRILAPYVGGSLPVWTGLIGIILGSLSLGYMVGGKLADQRPTQLMLSMILLVTACVLAIIPLLSKLFLPIIVQVSNDLRVTAVLATLLLFAFPSVLLGMISPYAIRLKLETITTSGETAGKLYAISTIGSIAGTFFAGFFLIAYLGSHMIIYVLAATMAVIGLLTGGKRLLKKLFPFVGIAIIVMSVDVWIGELQKAVLDTDTMYNRVLILDGTDTVTNRPIREMKIGSEHSSAMFLDGDELVYDYTKFYRLSEHFLPEIHHSLMVGGAGYSYPKYLQERYPQAQLDVVEIDPTLTELAKQYFAFTPTNKTTIYHEDARTFFNREEKNYDVIFNDAFASHHSHPFQLATKEAIMHMKQMLTKDGIVISNIISSVEGESGKFLRAEYYTYKEVFPYVYVFPVQYKNESTRVQNIIVIAAQKELPFASQDTDMKRYLSHRWTKKIPQDVPQLTDDYAPVEQYAIKLFE